MLSDATATTTATTVFSKSPPTELDTPTITPTNYLIIPVPIEFSMFFPLDCPLLGYNYPILELVELRLGLFSLTATHRHPVDIALPYRGFGLRRLEAQGLRCKP